MRIVFFIPVIVGKVLARLFILRVSRNKRYFALRAVAIAGTALDRVFWLNDGSVVFINAKRDK
ncbi:MAG: hypothetical protein CMI67_21240 [Pelagibaca sp.]|nr:hypothetical protein [Pelagibaca sp.]